MIHTALFPHIPWGYTFAWSSRAHSRASVLACLPVCWCRRLKDTFWKETMGNMVRQIKAILRKNGEPGHVRTVITLWFTLMLSWPKHKVLAKTITFWKVYWKAFFGQTSSLSYLTMWLPKERETWLRRNTVATSFECLHPSWLLLSKKLPTSRLYDVLAITICLKWQWSPTISHSCVPFSLVESNLQTVTGTCHLNEVQVDVLIVDLWLTLMLSHDYSSSNPYREEVF